MSPPVPEQMLNDLDRIAPNAKHNLWVRTDLGKDYFQRLIEANADYFILDLYADSHLSLFRMKADPRVLFTASYFYKGRASSLVTNRKDLEIVSHDDHDQFMGMWYEAINRFMSRLLEIFDESHIILQSVRRTTRYLNRKNSLEEISLFHGRSSGEAGSGDFYAESMENYLLRHYPKIRFIDMAKYELVGDARHPDKATTNHYQGAWYKAYVGELAKILLQDALEEAAQSAGE